mmetsp:Transcript_29248/g.40411  ORF Transcript_29248/g.40411 Transcript_29248/m.40411 type:complete len:205 (+) Transcript_29248:608-1222(+)
MGPVADAPSRAGLAGERVFCKLRLPIRLLARALHHRYATLPAQPERVHRAPLALRLPLQVLVVVLRGGEVHAGGALALARRGGEGPSGAGPAQSQHLSSAVVDLSREGKAARCADFTHVVSVGPHYHSLPRTANQRLDPVHRNRVVCGGPDQVMALRDESWVVGVADAELLACAPDPDNIEPGVGPCMIEYLVCYAHSAVPTGL